MLIDKEKTLTSVYKERNDALTKIQELRDDLKIAYEGLRRIADDNPLLTTRRCQELAKQTIEAINKIRDPR